MRIICIRHTEARAGLVRSALFQESYVAYHVALLATCHRAAGPKLLPFYVQLVDPRLADARATTFALEIGDWTCAAELEDVGSGVVPER